MIRIVLAEDQGMLLGALGSLLNLEIDMTVVGKAQNGQEAVRLVHELNPDICIMDIEMPMMTGLEAAMKLKDHSCHVMILTTFAQAGYFARAREAGVRGYMLKDSPSEELAQAIRAVMNGRRVYAPELMDLAYEEKNPLTEREQQVLELMASGRDTKEIAKELHLSNGTIRNYISVIFDKLNVKNRIEAITQVKSKGWFK